MMQQIVSLTSQNQISIPIDMIRKWGDEKPKKVVVTMEAGEIKVNPAKDFWSLGGALNKYALKNKEIDEVIKLEKKAAEEGWGND